MRHPFTDPRLALRAVLGLTVVLLAGWLASAPADEQNDPPPRGKRTGEEEEARPAKKVKKAKGAKKRDEEEEGPRPKRPLPMVGDEDEPSRPAVAVAADLAGAARSARHPAVKA